MMIYQNQPQNGSPEQGRAEDAPRRIAHERTGSIANGRVLLTVSLRAMDKELNHNLIGEWAGPNRYAQQAGSVAVERPEPLSPRAEVRAPWTPAADVRMQAPTFQIPSNEKDVDDPAAAMMQAAREQIQRTSDSSLSDSVEGLRHAQL